MLSARCLSTKEERAGSIRCERALLHSGLHFHGVTEWTDDEAGELICAASSYQGYDDAARNERDARELCNGSAAR
jgi:hypothetical protein